MLLQQLDICFPNTKVATGKKFKKNRILSGESISMTNVSAPDIEKKIEKLIYRTALALDDNDWESWFELCDEDYFIQLRRSAPR